MHISSLDLISAVLTIAVAAASKAVAAFSSSIAALFLASLIRAPNPWERITSSSSSSSSPTCESRCGYVYPLGIDFAGIYLWLLMNVCGTNNEVMRKGRLLVRQVFQTYHAHPDLANHLVAGI